jgi:hypothetical protein
MSHPSTTLVLSSADISPYDANEAFASGESPPLGMKLRVDTEFLNLSKDSFNNTLHVHLSKYVLDCVWRDALNPEQDLTSNAGTSISRRIKVFLYAGDPTVSTVRLLEDSVYRDASGEFPDFFIYRDQNYVNEKAHNINDTNKGMSVDLYFENQFTQQAETIVDPGVYLGKISAQAVSALKATSQITIQWKTDRTDYPPSPFWYRKFLLGSSVWDPVLKKFVIVDPNNALTKQTKEYYQKLGSIAVGGKGGPYFPLTLYTLENPINLSVAPFINDSNMLHVTDPPNGEVCPLNSEQVSMSLSQVALTGSTDLTAMDTSALPPLAPSDETGFRVPLYNVASQTVTTAFPIYQEGDSSWPSRYSVADTSGNVRSSITFPNGAWRGSALPSVPTRMAGWKSPYPWEQSLTPDQLNIVNGVTVMDPSSVAYRYQIVSVLDHLFMDPGTAWTDHNGTTTIGERSLQFDLGTNRNFFINKFQLLFPRSQESHQPYRLLASMQKAYRSGVENVVANVDKAFWMGGIQFNRPSGSKTLPENYRYLNTHSQSGLDLHSSYSTLWGVDNRASGTGTSFVSPSDTKITQLTANNYASSAESRGRTNVVKPSLPHVSQWYSKSPNQVNPALDFQRQEFGPFTRGATLAEIQDNMLCKAWVNIATDEARAGAIETSTTRYHFWDLVDYALSPDGTSAMQTSWYSKTTLPLWQAQMIAPDSWLSVTSSLTGGRLAAASGNVLQGNVAAGNIYMYASASNSFTKASLSSRNWRSIALSTSGNTLMGAATMYPLSRSEDYGATWSNVNGNTWTGSALASPVVKDWAGLAMASDARTGFAVAKNEYVYKYHVPNGGALTRTVDRSIPWQDVAMALDADLTVGMAYSQASVFYNTNGVTTSFWNSSSDSTQWNLVGNYTCIAASNSGNRAIVGTTYNGFLRFEIATSVFARVSNPNNNPGISWNQVVFLGNTNTLIWAADSTGALWRGNFGSPYTGSSPNWTSSGQLGGVSGKVQLAASRATMIAAVSNGGVYLNFTDSITGWVSQSGLPPSAKWASVTMSADGAYASACVEGGLVYIGSISGTAVTWRSVPELGTRAWKTVALSENGSSVYAGVSYGYLYASTDYGVTWTRDVTPSISTSPWNAIQNEPWAKVVIKNNVGAAISSRAVVSGSSTSYRMYRINVTGGTTAVANEILMAKNVSATRNYRAVACSDDASVAAAVVYGGDILFTIDAGETWSQARLADNTAIPSRGWTCVQVSADGRRAIAMADSGHIAIASTSSEDPTLRLVRTWTEVATYTGGGLLAWSSVSFDRNAAVFVATAVNQGIYVSTNGTSWTRDDTRLNAGLQTSPWSSSTVSGDGSLLAVGGTNGSLRILRGGETYYKMPRDATSRSALAGSTLKVFIPLASGPDFFLPSQASSLGVSSLAANTVSKDIYKWFLDNYKAYRVDCDLVASPSFQTLLSPNDYKMYIQPDGSKLLTTQSPATLILDNRVGSGNVLVASSSVGGTTRVFLIHPWYTTASPTTSVTDAVVTERLQFVVDPAYTKYITPSPLAVVKNNITITSTNNQFVLRWNNVDYSITIPTGSYTVSTLNAAFQTQMEAKYMYTQIGAVKTFYLRFVDYAHGITLQVDSVPRGSPPPSPWTPPYPWPSTDVPWPYDASSDSPTISIIPQTVSGNLSYGFGDVLGFVPGQYPTGTGATSKSSGFLPNWVSTTLAGTSFVNAADIYPDIYGTTGNREPSLEYIVKESYYFAPQYDQYDVKQTQVINGQVSFQPRKADQPQKVVNPALGSGRYFGVAFGSFLNDKTNPSSTNGVYTRGKGNAMKLFSFRPVCQLFSFETDSGYLKDKTGTATSVATFTNKIERGMLANVSVDNVGSKYVDKDSTVAYLHPTLQESEPGMYYDKDTGTFADTPMYLLTGVSNDIVQAASDGDVDVATLASVNFTLNDDLTSNARVTYTASDKTALRRSAEFHLRISNHAKK